MVRPLIAPMAEAAAEKASPKLAEEKTPGNPGPFCRE